MILGSFFYTIYSNGKIKEWREISLNTAINVAWGNVYESTAYNVSPLHLKTIESMQCVKSPTSTDDDAYLIEFAGLGTTGYAMRIFLVRPIIENKIKERKIRVFFEGY